MNSKRSLSIFFTILVTLSILTNLAKGGLMKCFRPDNGDDDEALPIRLFNRSSQRSTNTDQPSPSTEVEQPIVEQRKVTTESKDSGIKATEPTLVYRPKAEEERKGKNTGSSSEIQSKGKKKRKSLANKEKSSDILEFISDDEDYVSDGEQDYTEGNFHKKGKGKSSGQQRQHRTKQKSPGKNKIFESSDESLEYLTADEEFEEGNEKQIQQIKTFPRDNTFTTDDEGKGKASDSFTVNQLKGREKVKKKKSPSELLEFIIDDDDFDSNDEEDYCEEDLKSPRKKSTLKGSSNDIFKSNKKGKGKLSIADRPDDGKMASEGSSINIPKSGEKQREKQTPKRKSLGNKTISASSFESLDEEFYGGEYDEEIEVPRKETGSKAKRSLLDTLKSVAKTKGKTPVKERPGGEGHSPHKKPVTEGSLTDTHLTESSIVHRPKEKKIPLKKSMSEGSLFDDDFKVQIAAEGRMTRTPHMAKKFKDEIEKRTASKAISTTFMVTGESCAEGLGNVYKKYLTNGEQIYEVCFNDLTATTIYTTHISKPAVEKTKTERKEMDTKWRASYLLSLWSVDQYYTKKSQKMEYDRIFGSEQKYVEIEGSNWYAHAHLTPHGDFVEEEEQLSTYELHNCVPGKQSVNIGNWIKVENYGRGLTKDYNTDILVYTGVHEQLKLKNLETGKKTEAWLNAKGQRLAVPKIHWKLYINSANNESIAFFTSNDTEMEGAEVIEFNKMCSDKCRDVNFEPHDDPKKGITVCCTYREFRDHIKFLPKILPIGSEILSRIVKDKLTERSKSRSATPFA